MIKNVKIFDNKTGELLITVGVKKDGTYFSSVLASLNKVDIKLILDTNERLRLR